MRNLMLGNAIVRPVNAARIEILAGRGSSKNVYNYRSKLSAHGTMTWPCQSRNFSISAVRNLNDRDGQAHSFSDAHFGQERDREAKRLQKRRATHTDQETAKSNYSKEEQDAAPQEQGAGTYSEADHEHAVISTFDLFSIGIGPSSSHTVGPMRAGKIFVTDLQEANLLQHVDKIRISLFGSLAATGEGHMTPSALLLGLECADVETIDTAYVPKRFEEIKQMKQLALGKHSQNEKVIKFDYDKDLIWEWGKSLPLHSNGMRLTVFDNDGTMLGTNDMFSVGGGFVVNGALSTATSSAPSTSATLLRDRDVNADDGERPSPSAPVPADVDDNGALSGHPIDLAENMYYKEIRRSDAARDRRSGADINVFTSSDAGEGQGHLGALPEPNSNDVHEQNTPYIPGDTGSESMPAAKTSQRRNGPHFHFPFRDAHSLLTLCKQHNLTIAQIVYENEKAHGLSDEQIREKLMSIWDVMDASIREGVTSTDETLPGRLKLNRRAPALYRRLTRGLYPSHNNTSSSSRNAVERPSSETAIEDERRAMDLSVSSTSASSKGSLSVSRPRSGPPRVHGSFQHPLMPAPPRRTTFPAIDYLTVYAMAVNEVNAAGGRIVTAPTNGAAGILPAVLKYTLEFQSDDAERDIFTFMLTASAVGMLYKRGATISAAEGGCMAEVGVACSMAAAGFAACMGASPDTITQAAEIGIEHNLGLTCDPIGGLVQAPCIERNALGAIKAIASANLALSSAGTQKVSLDDAIRAMRLTAQGMRNEFKETSLSGLATSVSLNIPVSVPDC